MGYKEWLQELWRKYEPYAPPDFQTHIENDVGKLDPLTWEMLLANNLLNAGFQLEKVISLDSPDLCIMHHNKRVWIECCMPDKGNPNSNDAVPEKKCDGEFHEVEIDKNTLRYTNALNEKKKQYTQWLNKGICKSNEPYIIALHGRNLDFTIYDNRLPCILHALYFIGDMYVSFSRKNDFVSEGYLNKDKIDKTNGSSVSTDFFLKPENSPISGVIFSKEWFKHYSSSPNFCFVKNLYATNPIDFSFGSFMQEYDYTENSISIRPNE